MVVAVDRGRWTCAPDADVGVRITAMRARELGRTPVVVGDRVGLVGDVSGAPDALARIVRVDERSSVLRRTADDTDPYERIVVANAEQLLIVTSLADPPPRFGLIDRCLVASYAGGLDPVLCLTKRDLADPGPVTELYRPFGMPLVTTSPVGGSSMRRPVAPSWSMRWSQRNATVRRATTGSRRWQWPPRTGRRSCSSPAPIRR